MKVVKAHQLTQINIGNFFVKQWNCYLKYFFIFYENFSKNLSKFSIFITSKLTGIEAILKEQKNSEKNYLNQCSKTIKKYINSRNNFLRILQNFDKLMLNLNEAEKNNNENKISILSKEKDDLIEQIRDSKKLLKLVIEEVVIQNENDKAKFDQLVLNNQNSLKIIIESMNNQKISLIQNFLELQKFSQEEINERGNLDDELNGLENYDEKMGQFLNQNNAEPEDFNYNELNIDQELRIIIKKNFLEKNKNSDNIQSPENNLVYFYFNFLLNKIIYLYQF